MCGLHLWSRHVECCRREKPIKTLIPGVLPKTLEGCSPQEQHVCLTPDAGSWADPIGLITPTARLGSKGSAGGTDCKIWPSVSPWTHEVLHYRMCQKDRSGFWAGWGMGYLLGHLGVSNREPSGCGWPAGMFWVWIPMSPIPILSSCQCLAWLDEDKTDQQTK